MAYASAAFDDTSADAVTGARRAILDAARANAAFDGWGDGALRRAASDAGIAPGLARLAFPRATDLVLAFHRAGDTAMSAAIAAADLDGLRYSEKVARALELRLEVIAADREAVRRAAAFLALPQHAADAARAVWETADAVWTALGDTSSDINWYSKRLILSGVWSSVVLYWLGDTSEDMQATRAFIARRIGDVMRFEKAKAAVQNSLFGKALAAGPGRLFGGIRMPGGPPSDLPGTMHSPQS
jgi:ubiquinone biosynthesis protein COQ9